MTTKTYSFLDVVAAIVGPGAAVPLGAGSGAADEGIAVSFADNINTMMVGADGAGMHSLHAGRSGTVTVTLLKKSPTNAVLMAVYNFQTSSAANHGSNTITITDKNSGDVINCEQCAFAKAPDLSYGKDAGTVQWVFDCVRIDPALGA